MPAGAEPAASLPGSERTGGRAGAGAEPAASTPPGGPGAAGGPEAAGDPEAAAALRSPSRLLGPWGDLLFFFLLVAAALAVYHDALPVRLGSDARFLTYRNDWVTDPGGLTRFWTADFFEGSRTHAFPYLSGYYRPITNTLFWLEYRWAGDTDLLYNLGEVLLHAVNAFLVFLVVGRLFEDRLAGALAAGLFVVHPVHAMAATEPAARGDLLFATFYLLGLWIFDGGLRGMAGAEGGSGRRADTGGRARGEAGARSEPGVRGGWGLGAAMPGRATTGAGMAWRAWAVAGLYALSLLSKEMGATLPAAVVLLVLYRRFRSGVPWRGALWTLPVWGIFAGYLVWRFGVLDLAPPDMGYADAHPPSAVLLAALKTVPVHLSRILLPLGAAYPELNPELINFVPGPFGQPLTYTAILVVAGLLVAALLWKRHPALAFCSAFFLVTFTPLLRVENIAGSLGRDVVLTQERWIYLPAVGVFALLGLGVAWLWRRAGEVGPETDAEAPRGPGDRERAGEGPRAPASGGSPGPKRVAVAAGFAAVLVLLGVSAGTHAGQHDNPFARLRRLYLIPEERLGRMQLANKRLLYANWVAVPMRDFDDAVGRAHEALALAPDSPIVAYSVANVLAEARRWGEVARILAPWEAPSPEALREHSRTYVRVYDDLNRINPAIAYLLGRARAHLGEGGEAAGLLCTALRRGISEEDVERGLAEAWRYSGPPACADAEDPAGCAARAPAPPPSIRAPLDPATCPAWDEAIRGAGEG